MYKNISLLFISIIFLLGCQQNELLKTHGISYLDKRQKLIVVNKTNKNDAVIILGPPATKGMTDNNLWIYIERTISRGNLLKLGKNYIKKNNVLVLEFNNYGVVYKKEFYDKDKMKNISFAKNITENELKKENFIVGFLSSIRQKMESQKNNFNELLQLKVTRQLY